MTNWSLILNVLLLIGVMFALLRMFTTKRREKVRQRRYRAEAAQPEIQQDDIIAVRKVRAEYKGGAASEKKQSEPVVAPVADDAASITPEASPRVKTSAPPSSAPKETVAQDLSEKETPKPPSLMLFLLAKDDGKLAGYELLQSILAAGLRFGEGQLFHRHQSLNGQGPIICSLATATESGIFDLQNMGAFSVRGLCLFMEASGNPSIDDERLTIMLDTAKQLSDGLDAHLLDDTRTPWSDRSLARYHKILGVASSETAAYLD
ncbi:MAG: cell division protein ZipA C-terminal FtsZ-binding domain-containing protein [Legionellaceae bacterium]|nr:cell division protein ZipA C-terminal FtsZ-binding domain-containing protein [Legionellaceae bacterium]